MKINRYDEIPAGFLDLDPRDFHTILSGPTLIELKGKNPQPLFISTLLHGNECSGSYALQMLLKKYCTGNEERGNQTQQHMLARVPFYQIQRFEDDGMPT